MHREEQGITAVGCRVAPSEGCDPDVSFKGKLFFFCLMLLRITPCALNTLGFGAKKIVIKDEDLRRRRRRSRSVLTESCPFPLASGVNYIVRDLISAFTLH